MRTQTHRQLLIHPVLCHTRAAHTALASELREFGIGIDIVARVSQRVQVNEVTFGSWVTTVYACLNTHIGCKRAMQMHAPPKNPPPLISQA